MQWQRSATRARQSGFTLLEVIVVVVIIGILAAAVGPKIFGNVDKANANRVRQDIKVIEGALSIYRLDNFNYPTSEQGLRALVERPNDPNLTNYSADGYLDAMPKDPWGREKVYLIPGQRGEFDLYSLGRDGQQGGEGPDADLGNWD
ncbi:MAG: type II secretion system major pseudopilin GspG [Pseudomonadota bacterium]